MTSNYRFERDLVNRCAVYSAAQPIRLAIMRTIVLLCAITCTLFTGAALGDDPAIGKDSRQPPLHSPWPFLVGAGVVTWAYCKHGPDDCRTNTERLWGTALVISAGAIFWVWATDKQKTRMGVAVTEESSPALVLQYQFGG